MVRVYCAIKFALIVALPEERVTVVDANDASPNVAVPVVTVQFTKV